MGQYFKAVNETKKETICPWCLGGVAKLWEWAANPWGAVFVLLLRRSSGNGGGDYHGSTTQCLDLATHTPEEIAETIARSVLREGAPSGIPDDSIVGRWAGDEVYLVGDYDDSGLYEKARSYRNISQQVVETWNEFVELESMQLEYNTECSCQQHAEADA